MTAIRVPIRVRPGAGRHRVGGGVGDPVRLVVAVCSQAVDGKSTQAALLAVAEAIGGKRRDVSLVCGHTSRDKLIEIQGESAALNSAIERLLEA